MKRWPVIFLLISLGGCSLWDDYKHPETSAPEKWKTDSAQPATWPDAEWWKKFESPALTAQIEQANQENFDLKAAIARVQQADAQARIAGAPLLPSIDASANAQRNRTPGGRVSSSGFSSSPRINNSYNAGLNASYELDFWGKNWSGAEAARALAQASRYDQQTVILTTLSAVANNYFDILATEERLALARDNLASAEKLQSAFKQRFDAGLASALDVAQEESVVNSQRAAIPPLELRLRQNLDAQAILLAKLPENVDAPDAKLTDITIPEVTAGLPSELLQRRPDVANAEAQLVSANANIINARAAFFPNISLTAAGGYESDALSRLFRPDSMLWSLASSLAQPIFEGGLLRGQLDLAKAKYDEALQNYRKAVIAAFSDVEDSLAAVKHGAELEDAQKASMDTAHRAYDLSQQQFDAGIIDITTLLNTQRTLFSAQDGYAQARLTHLQAIVGLYKSLGGGWKDEQAAPAPAPVAATPEPAPAETPPEAPPAAEPAPSAPEAPATDALPDITPLLPKPTN